MIKKVELHDHLDGSLRYNTVVDLLKKSPEVLETYNGMSAEDAVASVLNKENSQQDLLDFLKKFDLTVSLMQTKESLFRIAVEAVEDAASVGIIYNEIRFAPVLHTQKGLSLNEVVDVVIEALKFASEKTGVKTGLILCGLRSEKSVVETAQLCLDYKDKGVCGFDLAGDEANFPPIVHKKAFDLLRENNYKNITCHAGEAAGVESVRQAIELGAVRIGHGVALKDDKDLIDIVVKKEIHIECCINSNIQTGAISSIDNHPSPLFKSDDVSFSFCTDDRLICNTDLFKEYNFVNQLFGLDSDMVLLSTNVFAIEHAFGLNEHEKMDLIDQLLHSV